MDAAEQKHFLKTLTEASNEIWKRTLKEGIYVPFTLEDLEGAPMAVKDKVVERIKEEMIDYLTEQKAFWKWEGHKHVAKLASDKLSDFFANLTPLYSNPFLQEKVGWALVFKAFNKEAEQMRGAENLWVIGSAMGAIGLAQSVARALHAYNPKVRCGYTEKLVIDRPDCCIDEMRLGRFDLGLNPTVVLVEDVMTTGSTTKKTIAGLTEANGQRGVLFKKKVLVAINRLRDWDVDEADPFAWHEIVSLHRVHPHIWDTVDDLPEGMKGCTPLRPKLHWPQLTTEMLEETTTKG